VCEIRVGISETGQPRRVYRSLYEESVVFCRIYGGSDRSICSAGEEEGIDRMKTRGKSAKRDKKRNNFCRK
jgi:hypothetical protein